MNSWLIFHFFHAINGVAIELQHVRILMNTMKNKKKSIFFVPLFYLIILTLSGCNEKHVDQNIYIDNGNIKLGFDKETGSLSCFYDLLNSYDWLDENTIPGSPWEIEFLQPDGIETIDIRTAAKFSYSKPDPVTLILKWKRFTGTENKNLKVAATITLENGNALSLWKISVNNLRNKQIKQVTFPRIAGLKDPGEEYLAVPQWMGQIMKDPRKHLSEIQGNVKKFEWAYPLLSFQCLALYNPDQCGFYAACNDSLTYNKNFSFSLGTLNNLVYKMHNLPSVDTKLNSYEPPYAAVIGSFKGDWITAAEIYREWGSKQRWARESRLKNNQTQAWLENTALWVWNRGKSDNVLVPAANLKQRLGLPISVFWHWWHGCSYDDGFPEYMPPREGKKSFISAIIAAQEKGIRAIVYMNQRLWGTTTESWTKENASVYAVKDPDGKINTHVYNIFTNKPTASMCLGTQFWKDKYASLCDSAVNTYKANGIYMDQACLTLNCYDNNHGHPVGSGNYWFGNFSRLSNQIRSKISEEKQLVLAGEGCGEAWLPYLDAFLTLDVSKERYAGLGPWETIPFFQAVYHQYAITYGNYSSLLVPPYDELWPKEYAPKKPLEMLSKNFNKQFLMEQARSFVWGMQPTIANYQDFLARERKEEIKYLLNLARIRNQALKYLLHGKFVRSPDIKSPEREFDISRLSIYTGKQGESVITFRGSFPLLYSGTWQADDMDLGIALASISDDPIKITFQFNSDYYNLAPAGKIYIIDKEGRKLLTSYTEREVKVNYTLKSKEICVLEITSNK
jgi:hypothetical protein